MTFDEVRGFNYQPGYAYNSYEAWRFFDAEAFRRELGLGKKYFPGMNTVRLWLSYDAYRYEEARQVENFGKALDICEGYGLSVIPVLFNCWHDGVMDNGGIYHPQMIPGSIWCANESMFDKFIADIVGSHRDDARVLAWDICNEPDSFGDNEEYKAFMEPYQDAWLRKMLRLCREAGAIQPCGISFCGSDPETLERFAEDVGVFLIHQYWFANREYLKAPNDDCLVEALLASRAVAEKHGKPIVCTETCWGAFDDDARAEIVRRTLSAYHKANIGFICHALAHTHVADLHNPEDGPTGAPENLAFMNKDGTLRKGHEVFNEF